VWPGNQALVTPPGTRPSSGQSDRRPAQRCRLNDRHPNRFIYRGVGPDFLDTLTGKLIELTTPGSKKRHVDKGGDYLTCDYALYNWKK
jgi:hypothetical protein